MSKAQRRAEWEAIKRDAPELAAFMAKARERFGKLYLEGWGKDYEPRRGVVPVLPAKQKEKRR